MIQTLATCLMTSPLVLQETDAVPASRGADGHARDAPAVQLLPDAGRHDLQPVPHPQRRSGRHHRVLPRRLEPNQGGHLGR